MKKLVVLLSIFSLLLTGCSLSKLNDNLDDIIDVSLKDDIDVYNAYFDGYKYYLPKGLKYVNKEEYNALFRDKYNNKYYLYVDIVSYYHKIDKKFKTNDNIFYSKLLKKGNKSGYLNIKKSGSKYYIECIFNYSKIEVYTDSSHLNNTVCNVISVLKSINYNDTILDSLVGENKLNYKEEVFNIFNTKKVQDNFLNYGMESDDSSEEETNDNSDEDFINIDDNLEN